MLRKEHVDNNLAVRNMLIGRGVRPELLPASEDLTKVKRKLESDEKKMLKDAQKNKKKKK